MSRPMTDSEIASIRDAQIAAAEIAGALEIVLSHVEVGGDPDRARLALADLAKTLREQADDAARRWL